MIFVLTVDVPCQVQIFFALELLFIEFAVLILQLSILSFEDFVLLGDGGLFAIKDGGGIWSGAVVG